MENKPEYLHIWSQRMDGAQMVLSRMRDRGALLMNITDIPKAENKVYSDAMYRLFLSDRYALQKWMEDEEIHFRNHERVKGKLIRCEAYVEKSK